jgi:hypothetical protein
MFWVLILIGAILASVYIIQLRYPFTGLTGGTQVEVRPHWIRYLSLRGTRSYPLRWADDHCWPKTSSVIPPTLWHAQLYRPGESKYGYRINPCLNVLPVILWSYHSSGTGLSSVSDLSLTARRQLCDRCQAKANLSGKYEKMTFFTWIKRTIYLISLKTRAVFFCPVLAVSASRFCWGQPVSYC